MTKRTTSPTGATVSAGPDVSTTYPLGYFREDYEFVTHTGQGEYLDASNGRFCKTPEYPNGIYCYFATVDANWNSAYPYVVGPTFYGTYTASKVTSISENTTTYVPAPVGVNNLENENFKVNVFPNPSTEFIAVQVLGLNTELLTVELFDSKGNIIQKSTINQGATNTYLDTRTLYSGNYLVKISGSKVNTSRNIVITK